LEVRKTSIPKPLPGKTMGKTTTGAGARAAPFELLPDTFEVIMDNSRITEGLKAL